jgi:hypothetical protein
MDPTELGTGLQDQKSKIPSVLPSAYLEGSEGVKEVKTKYKKAVYIGCIEKNRCCASL